jgi:uncharacterized membrane protein
MKQGLYNKIKLLCYNNIIILTILAILGGSFGISLIHPWIVLIGIVVCIGFIIMANIGEKEYTSIKEEGK